MTTVVPVRLIRSRRRMMPTEVVGSRLPVGSSARRMSGRFTKARAIDTRCCSPPDSSCGRFLNFLPRPTSSRMAGTWEWMTWRGRPITSRAKATFSYTLRVGRSLKSWKMQPMLRRRNGTFHGLRRAMSLPATQMRPLSGASSLLSRRMKVDLPEPDGPTRNTNSPLAMSADASRRATTSFL